jgi:hypothetical protein
MKINCIVKQIKVEKLGFKTVTVEEVLTKKQINDYRKNGIIVIEKSK